MKTRMRKSARLRLPALLLAGAALALTACAPPGTYSKVRGTIRKVVERDLGPADKYEVTTSRDSLSDLNAGRIARVEVHGVNVRTRLGVTLDDVWLSARDVKVNRKTSRVESAREASFRAALGEQAIASMLEKTGIITEPIVSISPSGVSVRGRVTRGPVPLNVAATGGVRVVSPTQVEFVPKSATVGGMPAPGALLSQISPALDFSRIYEPLMIQGVALEDGKAILQGTIDWSKIK